jgi:anti-sigma regulatory factor (Ser/Thr protein kinase)
LVVTELITNAIRHSAMDEQGVVSLDIRLRGGVLRCTVSDPGSGFEKPEVVRPHADRPGGFGLVILESVSDRWDVTHDELFRVWFELAV